MAGKRTLSIFVPSAGGLTGTFLVRHLSAHPIPGYEYRIVAADGDPRAVAKHFASAFHTVPMSRDPRYGQAVRDIVAKERIDLIFPLTSYDIPFYAAHKDELERLGARLLVCDPRTHERLHNKSSFYAWMNDIGVPVPRVYGEGETPDYPAIVKSTESSGSRGVHRLDDESDYRYWTAKLGDRVVTAFVEGTEFTVDCLFDRSHRLVLFNGRERRKTNGGAVVVTTQAAPPDELLDVLGRIESHLPLEGPVNFQYIRDRDGRLFLTDFNTRFASGGLPLTIAAGYDIPNLMIRLMLNEDVQVPSLPATKLTMYRYYDELFVEEP